MDAGLNVLSRKERCRSRDIAKGKRITVSQVQLELLLWVVRAARVMTRRAASWIAFLASAQAVRLAPTCGVRSLARSRVSTIRAAFSTFDDFRASTTAYLATLNETALNDPAFPSPLSYTELQNSGRVDLVEGCMKFGGYLKVSDSLTLR